MTQDAYEEDVERPDPPDEVLPKRMALVGVGLVLCSTVLFGSTPAVLTRLRGDMTLAELLTFRGMVAAPLLLMLAWVADSRSGRRRDAASPHGDDSWAARHAGILIGAFLYAPQLYLFYKSFDYIETSLAVAIGFVYPTLVIVLASARRRRWPSTVEISLSLVAVAGVVATTRTDTGATVAAAGVLLVLVASVIYAVYMVVAEEYVARLSPLRMGAQVTGSVAAATAVGGLLTGSLRLPDQSRTYLFIGVHAILLVVTVSLYYLGLERLGASHTSLIDTAQPLFAALAGALLLGERIGWIQGLGIALVTASVVGTAVVAQRRSVLSPRRC